MHDLDRTLDRNELESPFAEEAEYGEELEAPFDLAVDSEAELESEATSRCRRRRRAGRWVRRGDRIIVFDA